MGTKAKCTVALADDRALCKSLFSSFLCFECSSCSLALLEAIKTSSGVENVFLTSVDRMTC